MSTSTLFFLLLLIALPALLVAGLEVERLCGAKLAKSVSFNTFSGFFVLIVSQIFSAGLTPVVVWLAGKIGKPPISIGGHGWTLAVSVLAMYTLLDFAGYFYHRLQHRVPWLWAMHSFHHSDSEMNATTALRNFWLDRIVRSICFIPLGFLVTTSAAVTLGVMAVSWAMTVFEHLDIPVGLSKYSWLINTPQYHRTHHSIRKEHYDRNFAEFLPLWDVLFGTYLEPDGYPETGLTEGEPRGIKDALSWAFNKSRFE